MSLAIPVQFPPAQILRSSIRQSESTDVTDGETQAEQKTKDGENDEDEEILSEFEKGENDCSR